MRMRRASRSGLCCSEASESGRGDGVGVSGMGHNCTHSAARVCRLGLRMWPRKRKQQETRSAGDAQAPPHLGEQPSDRPVPFGYTCAWWALSTTDTGAVVEAVGLSAAQPANWETGVRLAYEGLVFVTPPIEGWTLIAGTALPPSPDDARGSTVPHLLSLSGRFGFALAFSTHRVVDYHAWAKAREGALVRGYSYIGESGQTLWDEGEPTPEEKSLGLAFFNERSPESANDDNWDREDLVYPDEEHVLAIADAWSVSPMNLDRANLAPGLGVLGVSARLMDGVS